MIKFLKTNLKEVSQNEMDSIYEKIKTPKKAGAVIKWDDYFTDSPTVFKYNGAFYMYFIAISKDVSVSGYETHIAKSLNLTDWEYIGPVFRRNDENNWDSKQIAGYVAFNDIDYNGNFEIKAINKKYYISYLAGNSDGYEPDPLFMGLGFGNNPICADSFKRLKNPILKPDDRDFRPFENKTLYKSCMFVDPKKTTGYPYVNVYNAKDYDDKERIFLAVSNDALHWERYGECACLDLISDDENAIITGDPQIIMIDDIYVMLFFRLNKGNPAYNTFACSRDLKNWRVWDGEPLVKSEFEWEKSHAHKSWFVRNNGVNYHFYCAVNDETKERFIALATS